MSMLRYLAIVVILNTKIRYDLKKVAKAQYLCEKAIIAISDHVLYIPINTKKI